MKGILRAVSHLSLLFKRLTDSALYANFAHCKIDSTLEHHEKSKHRAHVLLSTWWVQMDPHCGTLEDMLPNLTQTKISLIGHLSRRGDE